MKPIFPRLVISIFMLVSMTQGHAAPSTSASREVPVWHMEPATARTSGVALRLKESILVWNNPANPIPGAATEVQLLVDAPFAEVQLAVQKALATLGRFESRTDSSQLAYQADGWDEVLLSRRPDLRDALFKRFGRPALQLALKEGLLTAAEVDRRMALARADTTSSPQDRIALTEFQGTYPGYYSKQSRSYGILQKSTSELSVQVFDVSAAFGHPATAVRLSREDTYPNPDFSILKEIQEFSSRNILSRGRPPTFTNNVVPAPIFDLLRTALASTGAGRSLRVAPTPRSWMLTAEPASTAPVIVLIPPQTLGPAVEAETVPWAAIAGAQDKAITYPHDLLILPGGDLLLSATGYHDTRIWRLHLQGTQWKASTLWQSDAHDGERLALSADGRTAWFSGASNADDARLFSIDLETDKVTAYAVNLPAGVDKSHWELMGNQLPAYFDYRVDSQSSFQSFQPAVKRPTDGKAWSFRPTVKSNRGSMMNGQAQGGTMIWPVRWRGQETFWVEDKPGIAELDATSGRVLRAFALPQRFGVPAASDASDASGTALWVPSPLGSPEANWIATGFVLNLKDDGSLPPKLESSPDQNDRFVGMHVVDLRDGRVRLSALLGRSGTLAASARSANGRWLALGSRNVRSGSSKGPKVALWDVHKGQASVQLLASLTRDLDIHALAFSWSGVDLWAFCDDSLLHWRLPDGMKDEASSGSFPDQSRY